MLGLQQEWELICIDDGSTDATLALLQELALQRPYLRILAFTSNCGQSSAFDAGFKAALGEFVITLDGDLQNDPADIPKLLALNSKADLVCGYRIKRRDSWFKHIISRVANSIRSRVCQDGVRDTGCSLKVYRTSCLQRIKMYHGMHRFLPALFLIEGFTVCEVPVNHRPRQRGSTKYTLFNRSFNTIADMLAVRWMQHRHLRYTLQQSVSGHRE
jgi:dolichol-phosphate mannosyltransferase